MEIYSPIVLLNCIDYERAAQSGNDTIYRELDKNWNTLAPIVCRYEHDTPRSNYVSRELRKFYFDDQPINSTNNRKLTEVHIRFFIL